MEKAKRKTDTFITDLFTFDNHDPKRLAPIVLPSPQRSSGGGCVLLNDGTVKFIRTEEELHALRWKE